MNFADSSVVNHPVGRVRDFTIITPAMGTSDPRHRARDGSVGVATHLALGLALRREEVLGLEHEFVDYETGMIDIVQTLTYASGELHFGPPKSEAGRRTLVAPPFVLDALKRHRAMQAGRRLLYGTDWNDHGLVVDFATGVRGCRRRSRRTGADGLVATASAMSRSTD
jgi:hypothetical protein